VSTPVENLVSRLHARRSGGGWIAKCPAHDDHEPSLRIDEGADGRALVKCWAGCTLDAVLSAVGLTKKDLFPQSALPMSSRNGATLIAISFDWRKCVQGFTEKHVEQLAKWRGFSPEFVKELRDDAKIGIYNGLVAFPVRDLDGKRNVGAHFRLKSGQWNYTPKGINAAPFIFGEITPGESVQCFESTWDGLDYMDKSGERDGVFITRGAANAKFVELVPRTCTVYVWTQNDKPGQEWEQAICTNFKGTVKRVKVPAPYKDLNDWTRAGATTNDLFAAWVNAEVIRQAEKTWVDALNESVVTSSELHELQLTPRKELLGDWFCEGDLGFIFAFRGVGKTWLALAIAQALSAGGKLGEWQAHDSVKVLYVDGEMPPDLIRDRCEGLKGSNRGKLEFLNHEILFERTGKVLNITKPEVQQAITQRCVNTGSKVLILDNLSTLASGMRENEADSWELVNNWLLDLRRRKIAVIIVHHAGRSGEMRGTSKREDNVFWIIALDEAKNNAEDKRGARFVSRFTKSSRNTQEDVPAFEWYFVTDKATGKVSISHHLAQTMDVFLGLIEDGVTECSEIAQEMKTSKARVSRMAREAIKSKKIIKVGREYFLAEGAKNDPKA